MHVMSDSAVQVGRAFLYFHHIPTPSASSHQKPSSLFNTLQGGCTWNTGGQGVVCASVTLANKNYEKYCMFKSMVT